MNYNVKFRYSPQRASFSGIGSHMVQHCSSMMSRMKVSTIRCYPDFIGSDCEVFAPGSQDRCSNGEQSTISTQMYTNFWALNLGPAPKSSKDPKHWAMLYLSGMTTRSDNIYFPPVVESPQQHQIKPSDSISKICQQAKPKSLEKQNLPFTWHIKSLVNEL